MCGIAGVLGEREGVATADMLAALVHRGPDDEGEYRSAHDAPQPLWLGHRRLAIIDPSPAGRQPMVSHCGRFVIVFNGEIYNYAELRASLPSFVPRTGSDTEVILELFVREGEQMFGRLRGMFALALYDTRNGALVLVRDRHGEKPLYYFHDEKTQRLLFASEVRALLASGSVPRCIDPDGLDAYLTFGSVCDPYTLVNGVRAVAAGGVVHYNAGRVRTGTYWRLAGHPVNLGMTRASAVEGVRERLCTAQTRALVADVPVGILLSGGIDSSINVALLTALGVKDLHTFSVVFGGQDAGISEEVHSTRVAKRFGTRHETCTVQLDDAGSFLERAVAAMDQPSHDGLNTFAISEAIHAAGLKVAVSGQGADEWFLGYPQRHRFATLKRIAAATPRKLGSLLDRGGQDAWDGQDSRNAKLAGALSAASATAGAYLGLHSMFSPAAVDRLRGQPRPHPERFVEDVGTGGALDVLSRLQSRHYLKDTLLRDADQMSMAHALELRAPYLDHDLVDFLLCVPARHKLENGRNKPLLLDAAGANLPREVWDRPKRGFAMPVGRWILAGDTPPRHADIPGLDPQATAAVRTHFAQTGPGKPFSYPRVWTLDVLGTWLHRHGIGVTA